MRFCGGLKAPLTPSPISATRRPIGLVFRWVTTSEYLGISLLSIRDELAYYSAWVRSQTEF
jgi:hypothetical protein